MQAKLVSMQVGLFFELLSFQYHSETEVTVTLISTRNNTYTVKTMYVIFYDSVIVSE